MNETLESARERYQASLVEADVAPRGGYKDSKAYQDGGTRLSAGFGSKDTLLNTPAKAVIVNGKKVLVPTATKRTSPPRKDMPSPRNPEKKGGTPPYLPPKNSVEGEPFEEDEEMMEGGVDNLPKYPKDAAESPGKRRREINRSAVTGNDLPSIGRGLLKSKAMKIIGEKPIDFETLDQYEDTTSPDTFNQEEGVEEETPMTEAQTKFIEGLKAGADCYTSDKSKKRDESTSQPGADEGKPAPKKMADLLSEARAKFAENLIKNSAPSPGSLPQAKASFAEGLKSHCKKGK